MDKSITETVDTVDQPWLLLASHSAFRTHEQLNRVTTLSAEAAPLQRKIHGGAPET